MKEEWHNYIKKYLIIIVLSLLLGACGQSESQKDTKKDSISSEETMAYLERLTDPYVEMINIMITELVNIEERVIEKFKEVDDTSLSILQELEEDYEEDVDEIEDLINLASTLQDMVEIGRDDIFQIDDYSETIGFLVGEVSNKHLGGKIPDSLDKLLTEMDLSIHPLLKNLLFHYNHRSEICHLFQSLPYLVMCLLDLSDPLFHLHLLHSPLLVPVVYLMTYHRPLEIFPLLFPQY